MFKWLNEKEGTALPLGRTVINECRKNEGNNEGKRKIINTHRIVVVEFYKLMGKTLRKIRLLINYKERNSNYR